MENRPRKLESMPSKRLVNHGLLNNIEAYVQAFGRVGRDVANSEASLLFHGCQLQLCEPEMLDFVKCTTCRRENIPSFFDDTGENSEVIPKHSCCDICENDCRCGETECQGNTESMTFLMSEVTTNVKPTCTRGNRK